MEHQWLKFVKHTEAGSTWYRADNLTSPLYPRNIRVDIFPRVKAGRKVWTWMIIHEDLYPKSKNEKGAELLESGEEPTVAKAMNIANSYNNVNVQGVQAEAI
jgi:hypothetical protein